MKKLTLVTIAVLGALSVPSAFAVATGSRVNPWTFVGAAGDCGFGTPAGSPIVTAAWQAHIGVPDVDKTRQGLFLQKNGFTTDCSSAGASVAGVAGITLIEVGFDIRNDSQCSGGSPRFNVVTIDSMGNPTGHFVGGCGNSTMTADTPVTGWTRVRINPSNTAQAFPPIAPGDTVQTIDIVFDEGTDVGPGYAVLDNIDINGKLIGKPGVVK